MQKKIIWLTAVIFCAVMLGGCEDPRDTAETLPPETTWDAVTEDAVTEEITTEKAVTEEAVTEEIATEEAATEEAVTEETAVVSFAEQLTGIYKTYSEECGEIRLQVYWMDDNLIAEAEEEFAAYYAMELLPDEPEMLGRDGVREVNFTAYMFSGFSNQGAYWDSPESVAVVLTDVGFNMIKSDGTAVEYIRDDGAVPIHETGKYAVYLSDMGEGSPIGSLEGEWTASGEDGYNITLRIDANGTVLWCCKRESEPIVIHTGMALVDETAGCIQTMTERVGWADMPWLYNTRYGFDGDGRLILENTESDGLLPTDRAIVFTKLTEKE
ncbi:MAG: hypothetical protein E7638_08520 [Ruminococcaceae bacterium]|nr:hypothetical protein [Oscillospiraceae bacterium]